MKTIIFLCSLINFGFSQSIEEKTIFLKIIENHAISSKEDIQNFSYTNTADESLTYHLKQFQKDTRLTFYSQEKINKSQLLQLRRIFF